MNDVPNYPFEEFTGDLSIGLERLVQHEPVARVRLPSGAEAWLVTGYAETRQVLADPRVSRQIGRDGPRIGSSHMAAPDSPNRSVTMEGAPHAALRRLAARAFTARRVEGYRKRVEGRAGELVDALLAAGPPGDLVTGFADPLSMGVISGLLGVDEQDREKFGSWCDALVSVTAHTADEVRTAMFGIAGYLQAVVVAKRDEPGDDLISTWVAAQEQDDELTDGEIVELAVAVLTAGHGATVNAIASGVRVLLAHPDRLAGLRADLGTLGAVSEELLRYAMQSNLFRLMVAVDDLEVGAVPIKAGEAVMPLPFAANFDARVFAEPRRFDPDRTDNAHLAFGHGPHFCLGAPLARLELEVALTVLLERMPRLAPAADLDRLPWRTGLAVGGLTSLPVSW